MVIQVVQQMQSLHSDCSQQPCTIVLFTVIQCFVQAMKSLLWTRLAPLVRSLSPPLAALELSEEIISWKWRMMPLSAMLDILTARLMLHGWIQRARKTPSSHRYVGGASTSYSIADRYRLYYFSIHPMPLSIPLINMSGSAQDKDEKEEFSQLRRVMPWLGCFTVLIKSYENEVCETSTKMSEISFVTNFSHLLSEISLCHCFVGVGVCDTKYFALSKFYFVEILFPLCESSSKFRLRCEKVRMKFREKGQNFTNFVLITFYQYCISTVLHFIFQW